jgi:8-oxo-dGTP pyrophosphatase MutT (NUDIX family)
MLVRDGADPSAPLEVLMVRRNLRSDFVGGAYVFPGGAVDPADGGTEAETACWGRGDAEASEILGVGSGGLAYWVAVLRECFEEAGVLLAYGPPAAARPTASPGPGPEGRSLLSLAGPEDAARFARHRTDVNTGRQRFLDVCRAEGLLLSADRVHYFAHWVTPEGAPRRYDTRFFVAAAPADQVPAHDAGETIAATWLRPAEALARHREGALELIFPTIRNLQAIGRFATSAELLAAAAAAGRVPVVEPRVVVDGRGVRIMLPGDPDHRSATDLGDPGGAVDFNEAVRAVSRAANRPPPETADERPGLEP